jgi:hypothetical protein
MGEDTGRRETGGPDPRHRFLERNRDHILTLVKENYQQVDIVINRQYQSNKVLMKAVQSGQHGTPLQERRDGMNSVQLHLQPEATGEAYVLVPPSVAVTLIPLQGQAARPGQATPYPAAPPP